MMMSNRMLIVFTLIVASLGLLACEADTAREEAVEEQRQQQIEEGLSQAGKAIGDEAQQEWTEFEKNASQEIEAANEQLDELEAKLGTLDEAAEAEARQELEEARAQTRELEQRLDTYEYRAGQDWQEFKTDFDKSTDDIDKSLERSARRFEDQPADQG